MAALTERMRTFAGQTYTASQEAVADMEVINSAMDAIRARGNTSVKDMLADTDAVVQTVHTATDTIQTALTALLDQTDGYRADAGKRLDEIEDAVTELRGAVDDLDGHADDGLSDAFDTMDEELSELERQMKRVTKGMDGLSEDMKAVQDFLKTSDVILEEVRELLEQLGSGNAEDILQQLDELMNELSNALSHVKYIDPAGHLAQVSAGIEGATGALSDLVSDLNDLYEDTSEEMRKDWDRADDALDGLRDAVDGLRVRSKTFADAVSGEAAYLDRSAQCDHPGAEQLLEHWCMIRAAPPSMTSTPSSSISRSRWTRSARGLLGPAVTSTARPFPFWTSWNRSARP